MSADLEFLAGVPLIEQFGAGAAQDIVGLFERQDFEAGQTIFLVGDPGDCLYIVRRGAVELFLRETTGVKLGLLIAQAGDMFGEISVLDNGPRSATAVALEPSQLLVLSKQNLEKFLSEHPHAMFGFLKILAHKLRHADDLLSGKLAGNPNALIEEALSPLQKVATYVAEASGSIWFLIGNLFFFAIWILWNTGYFPGFEPFDPYPFGFLTMFVSLEAIVLSIVVLLAQNLQASREKIRGDVEYDINLKAELEVTHLHTKVDLLHAEVLSRLHNLEKGLKGTR